MQPLNIPEEYRRRLQTLTIQNYEAHLEPYLTKAFAAIDWPEGFTPRLLLAVQLHRKAVQDLSRDHDISDPRKKNPDMVKIMDRFIPDRHIRERSNKA